MPKEKPSQTERARLYSDLVSSQLNTTRLRNLCELLYAGGQKEAIGKYGGDGPGYTDALKDLGKALGLELQEPKQRKNDPVVLNGHGKWIARLADSFFSELDFYARQAKDSLEPVVLTIGSGETAIQNLIMPKISAIQDLLGDHVRIVFKNRQTVDLFEMLKDGRIDLAFARSDALHSPLKGKELKKVNYCICFPKEFDSEFTKSKPFKIFSKHPMVMMEGAGRIRRKIVNELSQSNGGSPMIRLECSSHGQILTAIQSENYCGLLPDYLAESLDTKRFKIHPTKGFSELPFSVVWNEEIMSSTIRTRIPGSEDFLLEAAIEALQKVFKK
jgi:DNA-binding transcriptional LysR family regulator